MKMLSFQVTVIMGKGIRNNEKTQLFSCMQIDFDMKQLNKSGWQRSQSASNCKMFVSIGK